jgi:hypothetical protein
VLGPDTANCGRGIEHGKRSTKMLPAVLRSRSQTVPACNRGSAERILLQMPVGLTGSDDDAVKLLHCAVPDFGSGQGVEVDVSRRTAAHSSLQCQPSQELSIMICDTRAGLKSG